MNQCNPINFNNPLSITTIVLDAGHGSIDPTTGSDSEALTRVYKFPHNGRKVYEGQINRLYTKTLKQKFEQRGFNVAETAPDHKDVSLRERVAISNRYGSKHSYFLSIHNNGSTSHTATGAEGYTSRGDNRSDDVMESILFRLKDVQKLRRDMSDGDLDKEYDYYVIRKTSLRAGLLEVGFYDNWEEYLKLVDDVFIEKVTDAIVQGVIDYNNSLT